MTRKPPRLAVRLVLGIAVFVLAAPAAQAYPVEASGTRIVAEEYVPFVSDFPKTSVEVPQYGLPRPLPSDYGVVVREEPAASPGFAWGDAGIGLAAGAALGLLGIAGAIALRRKDDELTPTF